MMMNAHESSETQEIKAENERVKKMLATLQEKLAQTLAGKSHIAEKADETAKGSQSQIDELRQKLEKVLSERDSALEVSENLRKETMNTKQELQKKVNQLTQVTNMKKMIQDKNTKITELRERLSKYEADIGGEGEDDI